MGVDKTELLCMFGGAKGNARLPKYRLFLTNFTTVGGRGPGSTDTSTNSNLTWSYITRGFAQRPPSNA